MELTASQMVKLYMEKQVLTGSIYYAPTPEARLLDALNGIADTGPVKRGKFLELNHVSIQHDDGRQEKLGVSYINRATVILAATIGEADAGRGIGARPGLKTYPFIEKTAIAVSLETQDYFIVGYMHRLAAQKVWSVLEDALPFLPLTSTVITNRLTQKRELMPFIAVNKEHIISVHEEDHTSPENPLKSKIQNRITNEPKADR